MRKRLGRAVGALVLGGLLAGFAPAASAQAIHVFLIGGQSNANGHAKAADLPPEVQAPQPDVSYYYDTAHGKDYVPPVLGPLAPRTTFGPEVTFGRAMADFYAPAGGKVAILQYAVGGSNLYAHWKAGETPDKDGPLFRAFKKTVTDGMAALKQANPDATITIDGMLWMQGEADASAGPPESADYAANLTVLIKSVRKLYGEHLPFLIGRLSTQQTTLAAHLADLRQAQESVAAADPANKLVDSDNCEVFPDHLHFDAKGQQTLGKSFAAAMQAILASPPQ